MVHPLIVQELSPEFVLLAMVLQDVQYAEVPVKRQIMEVLLVHVLIVMLTDDALNAWEKE